MGNRTTKVTEEDLAEALADELGVKYSPDGKRLLEANSYILRENGVTSYTVKPGTRIICNDAFFACDCLEHIVLPDSVTHIGDGAFERCGSLKSINIPDGIEYIGKQDFEWCGSLRNVSIPDIDKFLGDCSQNRVKLFQKIMGINNRPQFDDDSSETTRKDFAGTVPDEFCVIYSRDGKRLLKAIPGLLRKKNVASITVKPGTEIICNNAFHGCDCLESVLLPDSVTSIGSMAFHGCESLKLYHPSNTRNILVGSAFFCRTALFLGCFIWWNKNNPLILYYY